VINATLLPSVLPFIIFSITNAFIIPHKLYGKRMPFHDIFMIAEMRNSQEQHHGEIWRANALAACACDHFLYCMGCALSGHSIFTAYILAF
jgi:hypothetical protein